MRYNIFNTVHLPLKNALITNCLGVSDLPNQSYASSARTLNNLEELLRVFNEQIDYEKLYVFPFIFDYEPSVWNNYITEHMRAASVANNLKNLIRTYCKANNAEDKTNLKKAIIRSYNEFVLFNFNHMDDEEAVLNEILWRYYPDEVLIQIEEKMEILPRLIGQSPQKTEFKVASAA